jgi:hypothetical protein
METGWKRCPTVQIAERIPLDYVAATWEKVRQNPDVKKVLLATDGLVLKPDDHQVPNAPAAWRYYEILTQIRTELRHELQSTR